MTQKHIFDFLNDNEFLYLCNHETVWRHACQKAGIDPDELIKKEFRKQRRKK